MSVRVWEHRPTLNQGGRQAPLGAQTAVWSLPLGRHTTWTQGSQGGADFLPPHPGSWAAAARAGGPGAETGGRLGDLLAGASLRTGSPLSSAGAVALRGANERSEVSGGGLGAIPAAHSTNSRWGHLRSRCYLCTQALPPNELITAHGGEDSRPLPTPHLPTAGPPLPNRRAGSKLGP